MSEREGRLSCSPRAFLAMRHRSADRRCGCDATWRTGPRRCLSPLPQEDGDPEARLNRRPTPSVRTWTSVVRPPLLMPTAVQRTDDCRVFCVDYRSLDINSAAVGRPGIACSGTCAAAAPKAASTAACSAKSICHLPTPIVLPASGSRKVGHDAIDPARRPTMKALRA